LRKLFVGALVGALALAVAAVAFGATTQNYDQRFTKKTKKTSTGTSVVLSSEDTENSEKNFQPDALRQLDLLFPRGTHVDPRATRKCKASDTELEQQGPDACPNKSSIGTGDASAKLPSPTTPDGRPLPDPQVVVEAFNAPGGLVLHLQPSIGGQPTNAIILRPRWRGRLKGRPILRTNIPANCYPPATRDADGVCRKSDGSQGDEIILNSFKLNTLAKSKGKGKKRRHLIRTPRKCGGEWTFTGKFTFASGDKQTLRYKDRCRQK
jgi:hypothetical protein